MKRLLALLTPIIGSILIILGAPTVLARLNKIYPNSELHITIFLVIGTFITFYFNSVSPLLKYEKLARKRWVLLKQVTEELLAEYESCEFHINIMMPKRKILYFLEPKKSDDTKRKLTLFGSEFKTIWESEKIDKRFRLSINQGLAGYVFNSGTKSFIDGAPTDNKFNFNPQQKAMLSALKIVISCPLNIDSAGVPKTIGVINLHSSHEESLKILKDEEWAKLQPKLKAFSKMCVNIL